MQVHERTIRVLMSYDRGKYSHCIKRTGISAAELSINSQAWDNGLQNWFIREKLNLNSPLKTSNFTKQRNHRSTT